MPEKAVAQSGPGSAVPGPARGLVGPVFWGAGLDPNVAAGTYLKKNALQVLATDYLRLGGAASQSNFPINISTANFSGRAINAIGTTGVTSFAVYARTADGRFGMSSAHPLLVMSNNLDRVRFPSEAAGTATMQFEQAIARIVGGATSLAARDNANANNNLLVSDSGRVTVREELHFASGNGGHLIAHALPTTGDCWLADIQNTSGRFIIGLEGVAGGVIAAGAPAYSTVLATETATPLVLGSNGKMSVQLDDSAAAGDSRMLLYTVDTGTVQRVKTITNAAILTLLGLGAGRLLYVPA